MKKKIIIGLLSALLVLTTSCDVDNILCNTPHPTQGAVVITPIVPLYSTEAQLPSFYCFKTGGNDVPELWSPGEQILVAYNEPTGIRITGNIATVTDFTTAGYLFSVAQTVNPLADDTLRVIVPLIQRSRHLTLVLTLPDEDNSRLASTEATLTGLAAEIDIATGKPVSAVGATAVPVFIHEENTLRTDLTLPGILTGERQILTLTLHHTDGYIQTVETDLTENLKSFYTDITPLNFGAGLYLDRETRPSFGITDWVEGLPDGGGTGDAV